MPRMSGLEMLLEVKDHPEWRNIPVIVVTTSRADGDVWESYHRHANAYVVKAHSLRDFTAKLKALSVFWRAVAELSPENQPPREQSLSLAEASRGDTRPPARLLAGDQAP